MKFNYFRIFAVKADQQMNFEGFGREYKETTRQEYLENLFSENISFNHRQNEFNFVPVEFDGDKNEKVISGRIGSAKMHKVNASPAKGFEPANVNLHHASLMFVDTKDFSDGQKIAMEIKGDVGKPLSIVQSLIKYLNDENSGSGWHLEVNLISEEKSFWSAVNDHKGDITKAEFNYITPNVLGLSSDINKRLKNYHDMENAHRVTVSLENDDGDLTLVTQEVKDAVEYISKGGGVSKLKSGRNLIYSSDNDKSAVIFELEKNVDLENDEIRKAVIEMIFKRMS